MSFYGDLREALLALDWKEVEPKVFFKNGCWFLADTRQKHITKQASIVNILRSSWQVEYGHYVLSVGKADKYMSNYDTYPKETQENVVKNFVSSINRFPELPPEERIKGCKTLPRYTNGFRVLDETPLERHTSHFRIEGDPQCYQYVITPEASAVELVDGKDLYPFCSLEEFVSLCQMGKIHAAVGAENISSGSLDTAKIQENGITNRIADLCNTVQEWYDLQEIVDSAKNPTLYLKNPSLRSQFHRTLLSYNIQLTENLVQANFTQTLLDLVKLSEEYNAPYESILNSNLPDIVLGNMVSTVQTRMLDKSVELQKQHFNNKIIPALLKVDNPEEYRNCQYPSQVRLMQDSDWIQNLFNGVMIDRILHTQVGEKYTSILAYFHVDLDNIYAKALNEYLEIYMNPSRTIVYHENFGLGIEYGKATFYRDLNSIYLVRNEDEKVIYRYTFINGDCIFGGSYCPILLQV